MSDIGCFGKVPAHGDFVWQGLPARFVTPWDNWIQEALVSLRESHPDDWLDHYLRGSIWRFLIRDDALGPETWAGIVLPSVDIVGRYFPFTVATDLPRYAPLASTQRALGGWLAEVEEIALDALSNSLPVDDVLAKVRGLPLPEVGERCPDDAASDSNIWRGRIDADERWEDDLLDRLVGHSFQAPCHWSCIDADSGGCKFILTDGFAGFNTLFTG